MNPQLDIRMPICLPGSSLTFWGGGGGGVAVNGEKPTGEHSFTGEGYGGGGCFVDKGLPGCVLINM